MKKKYWLVWIMCTLFVFLVWKQAYSNDQSRSTGVHKSSSSSSSSNNNKDELEDKNRKDKNANYDNNTKIKDVRPPKPKLKKILYWNQYFKSNDFKFGLGQLPFRRHNCRVNTCTTTNDRSTLADADVIMFHGPQIGSLPDVRYPRQLYVYVQKEPWMDMSRRLMPAYRDVMNLTMTYRRDSDVVLPYALLRRNASDNRRLFVDPESRERSVVWVVSHCNTDSQREVYVGELRKYIDVDVYGECGPLTCDKRHNRACWEVFANKYRFMVAMENSVCRDYVSEKAYRPLNHYLVPIVFGGADYDAVTPPHSVIDVRHFPEPRELANYLKYLTRNSTAYNEYFSWKSLGYHIETYRKIVIGQSFCDLCELLHEGRTGRRHYVDLTEWWVHDACDNDVMTRFKASW